MKNTTTDLSSSQPLPAGVTDDDMDRFNRDGFLVVPGLAAKDLCRSINRVVDDSLDPPLAPLEFEADILYPGAPKNKAAHGGFTPRRLLHAYTRDEVFRQWARSQSVVAILSRLMSTDRICLSQNHHNCIMTKHPGYSSLTSWHQDVRYWRFDRPELVSVWLALVDEYPENGGLLLIPGSHTSDLGRGRLDASLFLRTDLKSNRDMIDTAVAATLSVGDAVFFHCKTYHAAGRNQIDQIKKSLVYTYRAIDNQPIPDTRSAVYCDIEI
ncbi:MAG: phytanoyl-CoA dioxygenase [marine bacterium B5-7]|nr:MAG: phytanoyl-CoA dioxygenase [marine bacterium B5-7]